MTKASHENSRPLAQDTDARHIMQHTLKFFSLVLGLAAIGMWLAPGAADDGAEALVRLVVSFLFLGIGAGLWGAGRPRFEEEFHLDVVNHRLTHVLRGRDGIARTQEQFGMDQLDLEGGVLTARKSGGQSLRLPISDCLDARALELLAGMRKRTLA
ncbi:hypothetical protein [Thalassovita sp.]|uniref:hypothetical protein n=1 Tax=Thalassovita sp. TaxID=1979401 RepID=UPI003B598DB4